MARFENIPALLKPGQTRQEWEDQRQALVDLVKKQNTAAARTSPTASAGR